MQTSTILATIANAMAPYIGITMARSSIEMHCKNMGINGQSMDGRQIDELLNRLALGLNIFIGRDKTVSLVSEIRSGMETSI
jgi:hypothetical protein